MMRLVVLGSGTLVPSGTRNSSGYWVETGGVRLRLDCGSGTVHAMHRCGLPWEQLTHQFITHFHLDHVGELPFLLFSFKYGRRKPRQQPLHLVGPVGLQQLLEGLEGVLRQGILHQDFPLRFVELAPGASVELEPGVVLRVCKAPHRAESLAVRVESEGKSLAYTGDTMWSDELVDFFQGVDLLISECSSLEPEQDPVHVSADQVSAMASQAGVKHLVATHCYFDPFENQLQQRLARSYDGEITVAVDGLSLTV